MTKIDLIIDALSELMYSNSTAVAATKYEQALAAAREMRELKPVARVNSEGFIVELGLGLSSGTKLYALDEVTK
jgi:glycerol-3-phosphate O-acyltransferase